MTAPVNEPTPCASMPRLFDSTNLADHVIAKQVCESCYFIDWCKERLEHARDMAYPGHGPQGTWAGQYVGMGDKEGSRKTRPYNTIAMCGTESGYKRHRRQGEEACGECKAALKVARLNREARRARELRAS